MSDDRPEWEWKLVTLGHYGPVVAQVKEVSGPGRHFLLRRICGIGPGKPGPDGRPSFVVLPSLFAPGMLCGGAAHEPWVVQPSGIIAMGSLPPANEEAVAEMFKTVKVAKPGDVSAEEQKQNRLRVIEGRNGGGQ